MPNGRWEFWTRPMHSDSPSNRWNTHRIAGAMNNISDSTKRNTPYRVSAPRGAPITLGPHPMTPDPNDREAVRTWLKARPRPRAIDLQVLEAWKYRVPQLRSRLFVVGVANDGKSRWPKPGRKLPTVGDVIGDLPMVAGSDRNEVQDYEGPPGNVLVLFAKPTTPTLARYCLCFRYQATCIIDLYTPVTNQKLGVVSN